MAHHHGPELNARVTLESVLSMGAGNNGQEVGTIPSRPAGQEDLLRIKNWRGFLLAPWLLTQHCSCLGSKRVKVTRVSLNRINRPFESTGEMETIQLPELPTFLLFPSWNSVSSF